MADCRCRRSGSHYIVATERCYGGKDTGGLLHKQSTRCAGRATAEDACRVSREQTCDYGRLLIVHDRHIEIDQEHNSNLFFWHYENRHIADRQRTILWLNGGPGCSSMDGAMMEVGPYRVRHGGNLEYNNGSWDEFANLLFVDQPVGTGFSYVNTDSYLTDLNQMADHMMIFLDKWFKLFPEYEDDDVSLNTTLVCTQSLTSPAIHCR
jgi:carboxypeptidase C (cathepsin A)